MECFHDVPDPSGIIFGQRITGNSGMRLSVDQFLTFLNFFWTTWHHLGPLGTPWDPLGPLGTTWDHLGPLGTPWDPLGPRILKDYEPGVLPPGAKKSQKMTPVCPGVQFSGFLMDYEPGVLPPGAKKSEKRHLFSQGSNFPFPASAPWVPWGPPTGLVSPPIPAGLPFTS